MEKETKFIAVDGAKILACGMSGSEWKKLSRTSRSLLRGWWLVASKDIPSDVEKRLREDRGVQSVFTSSETFIVTYPEIRIEESRRENADLFLDWLDKNKDTVNILEESDEKWLIEPKSGSGEEAMELAEEIKRHVDLQLCQSRFVRIVKGRAVKE